MTTSGLIRKRFITPDASDVLFDQRGFAVDTPARAQLELSALQLVFGFEFGIEHKDHDSIIVRLDALSREYRGFAYEGATMALAIRDALTPLPGRSNVEQFLAGPDFTSAPASKHIFMAYIGVGFALARLPRMLWSRALPDARKLADHPSLSWLIMDGYGFHLAYFDHVSWVENHRVPGRLPWPGPAAYTNRVIDHGIGRAMWFVHGGDVDRLLHSIRRFPPDRHADLLSGAGLAASYAGGVTEQELGKLVEGAGAFLPEVAQGAIFAMRARVVADLVTPHSEMAAQVFCGRSAEDCSEIAAKEIENLPEDGAVPAYEVFRQRVQNYFR
ncbi:DUF1702 family protein [Lentzea sp. NPDC051208]|uniref:DUF1702 family protein n=1 Tax=Lentzea sp. NPDC051208 TaxID=3154642 RepID=UPI0034166E4A